MKTKKIFTTIILSVVVCLSVFALTACVNSSTKPPSESNQSGEQTPNTDGETLQERLEREPSSS
jgi:ABC-type oligopeptide transport system substrate-binding subunit